MSTSNHFVRGDRGSPAFPSSHFSTAMEGPEARMQPSDPSLTSGGGFPVLPGPQHQSPQAHSPLMNPLRQRQHLSPPGTLMNPLRQREHLSLLSGTPMSPLRKRNHLCILAATSPQ